MGRKVSGREWAKIMLFCVLNFKMSSWYYCHQSVHKYACIHMFVCVNVFFFKEIINFGFQCCLYTLQHEYVVKLFFACQFCNESNNLRKGVLMAIHMCVRLCCIIYPHRLPVLEHIIQEFSFGVTYCHCLMHTVAYLFSLLLVGCCQYLPVSLCICQSVVSLLEPVLSHLAISRP